MRLILEGEKKNVDQNKCPLMQFLFSVIFFFQLSYVFFLN